MSNDLVSKEPFANGGVCAPGVSGSLPLWKDPALPLGERCVIFAREELARNIKENLGPNDAYRIRDYFKIPFVRRATGKPISISAAEWCAASACFTHYACALPGEAIPPHRVAGVELEQDAKEAGTWLARDAQARAGDLAIYKRAGESWSRHVTRVVSIHKEEGILWTIGGNESDTWKETPRKLSDPNLLGFIRIGL